jgi:hypothetical protein
MRIREGAYYRTRDGDVVGPMRLCKDQSWYSCYHQWNEDGGIFSSGAEHGLDLISEVYVSDTPHAALPIDLGPGPVFALHKGKTLQDEFAMAVVSGVYIHWRTSLDKTDSGVDPLDIAEMAYGIADAMMEARKK